MKRILLLTGFAFIIAQVYAQFDNDMLFDFDLVGKGARAAGMGYAFNAVADDATALSWNPAGIGQIKKPEIAFSNSLKNPEYRHAINEYDFKPVYSFDFLGFVYPIKLKKKDLVFGISYQNKMNFKFNYENLSNEWGTKNGENTLSVNSVSFSGAYSICRFISVGLSYNKWFSLGNKLETYSLYYEKKIYQEEADKYPDESVFIDSRNYKYSGNNFTLGILLDFSSWHFPLKYTLKYDSKIWIKDNYDYSNRLDYNYFNGNDTTWLTLGQGIEKFEYPGILTNGMAFRIDDYLTIACDFDLQLFKENIKSKDYFEYCDVFINDQNFLTTDTIYYHDEDYLYYNFIAFNQYRIGLEYILHPDFGLIPLRAGWKSNPDELETYNENYDAVKRVMAHSINVGTGITLERFSIDFAYESYWFHRKDEKYMDEKQINHFFVLSAIWYIK
jgi:long-subunit fatty acid transport protein